MKPIPRFSLLLLAVALACSLDQASANITQVDWASVCSTLNCSSYSSLWDSSGDISVGASQTGPGSMGATITTDTILDPTLTINNAIDNDTSFDWTSYIVDIYLSANFTLSGITSANPPGWSGAQTIAPYLLSPGLWTAEITYSGGTPVNTISGDPNNELDFTYKVTFSGSTSYSLTEQVNPVPEPAVFSLLLCGLVAGGLKVRGSRKAQS
jgi:hypothetical protein